MNVSSELSRKFVPTESKNFESELENKSNPLNCDLNILQLVWSKREKRNTWKIRKILSCKIFQFWRSSSGKIGIFAENWKLLQIDDKKTFVPFAKTLLSKPSPPNISLKIWNSFIFWAEKSCNYHYSALTVKNRGLSQKVQHKLNRDCLPPFSSSVSKSNRVHRVFLGAFPRVSVSCSFGFAKYFFSLFFF